MLSASGFLSRSAAAARTTSSVSITTFAENNTAGQAQRSYIYLNGVPLAVVNSFGQIDYVLSSHLGQPQKMVNSGGLLIWDQVTDEFGQLVSQQVGQSSDNALRFPGQIADAATGLYYNYFRDYEPGLGRYIQPDPIGVKGGIDPYGYAAERPVVAIDPLGLKVVFAGNAATQAALGDAYAAVGTTPRGQQLEQTLEN